MDSETRSRTTRMSGFVDGDQFGAPGGRARWCHFVAPLRRHEKVLWLFAALFLVCLMPSNQSLWIDEGFTVQYAYPQSLSGFMNRIYQESGSEALMPFGMFSTWAGAKVFGSLPTGWRIGTESISVIARLVRSTPTMPTKPSWLADYKRYPTTGRALPLNALL